MTLQRPATLFGRAEEWNDLVRFVERPGRLGVVWGPRRAGKSMLLASLSEAADGLYYEAVRQDPKLTLAELGVAVGARLGVGPLAFADWSSAVESLTALPGCPIVVLDEFGYLCESSPELPSVIQRAVDAGRRRSSAPSRLVLCGSSVTQLSHLLDRDQPLFGRAQLAAVVDAFDVRTAAEYWGVGDDPRLAFRLHAVLGGLPGYRDVVDEPPESLQRFDSWVTNRVLTPASPLLEEDSLVFQSSGLDANVYRSVLAAVARGDRTPTGVSSRIGRPVSALARPFDKLTEARLLTRVPDPLRSRRSTYRLADPFLTFHDSVIRPNRTRIRRRDGRRVWSESLETWNAQILGPHFEQVCREVTLRYGDDLGLEGVTAVGASTLSEARRRTTHDLDLVATDHRGHVVAVGEAKHTTTKRDLADLERLDHLRSLLPNPADRECALALFSAAGFTSALQRAAGPRHDVRLIDLDQLYGR